MAQLIAASVYGIDGNALSSSHGRPMAFPSLGITVDTAAPGTVYAGVTCLSVIQVLPTGLNQPPVKYYTAKTVAEIVTLANAALA